MSLGYILVVMCMVMGLVLKIGIVFPLKKKIYVFYTSLVYSIYIFSFEIWLDRQTSFGFVTSLEYLLFGLFEVLLMVFFVMAFSKSATWKTITLCFLMVTFEDMISAVFLCVIPYVGDNFEKFLIGDNYGVSTFSGIMIFVLMAFYYFFFAIIYRHFIKKDNYKMEKYYRILFVGLLGMVVYPSVSGKLRMFLSGDITVYNFMFTFSIVGIGWLFVLIYRKYENHHIDSNIAYYAKKESRGDSNKEIKLFEEDSELNAYLNECVNKIKNMGIYVDVISYLADTISLTVNDRIIKRELYESFKEIEEYIYRKKPYSVICFKKNRSGIFIHIEYNKKPRGIVLSKMFNRDYLSVHKDYYRYDISGRDKNEITFFIPVSE